MTLLTSNTKRSPSANPEFGYVHTCLLSLGYGSYSLITSQIIALEPTSTHYSVAIWLRA